VPYALSFLSLQLDCFAIQESETVLFAEFLRTGMISCFQFLIPKNQTFSEDGSVLKARNEEDEEK
jgi:hypothetical protein